MKNKNIIISAAIILFIGVLSMSLGEISNAIPLGIYDDPVIIIDAGHGEFDGGAVADDGTLEKDINLKISLKLRQIMQANGYKVIMTRTTDSGTDYTETTDIKSRKTKDMKNRLKLMNTTENAIYVSIHLNKFNSKSAKGAQVFYSPNENGSKELGGFIQKNIVDMLQNDNDRVIKQGSKNTYLLYYAEKPAVIVECGFISNNEELILLKDDVYQSKMAFAISCGILDYID